MKAKYPFNNGIFTCKDLLTNPIVTLTIVFLFDKAFFSASKKCQNVLIQCFLEVSVIQMYKLMRERR